MTATNKELGRLRNENAGLRLIEMLKRSERQEAQEMERLREENDRIRRRLGMK
jgi:hypothetical protein